jgi:hypothetical protein
LKEIVDRVEAIRGLSKVFTLKHDYLNYQSRPKRKQKNKPSIDEDKPKDIACQADKNGKIDCNA